MTYEAAKILTGKLGQEQLLEYYGELSAAEKKELLDDIKNTDFSILDNIGKETRAKRENLSPADAVTIGQIARRRPQFEEVGLKLLREGKVGAVLLAGGQGSRLGFNKPKGMFDMGITRHISIFGLQMKNVVSSAEKAGRPFPLFVMTSTVTDGETRRFFAENNYFGYPRDCIHFFVQEVAPACDYSGKVFLDRKNRVALSPNGNGGWYTSLIKSGLGNVVSRDGVEWLNVYGVDNVLQKICDPAFIGATVLTGSSCGAKVVKKTCPEEKVGVLCKENGKPAVIEYYEMPEKLKSERTEEGLKYCYGVILNYLFNVRQLNATLSGKLPYHFAEKAIAHMEKGVRIVPTEPCGYKPETLVVDIVGKMDSCLAFEVERNKEFAPVKNAEGADSVETARILLKENGVVL